MKTNGNRDGKFWFSLCVCFAALALRLTYGLELQSSPFFVAPTVDSQKYFEQALTIAGGDLLLGDEPFWQPPLYPYFLGLVCWVFPQVPFVAIRIAQALLGSASCLLIYLVAREAGSERAARISALAAVFCGTFLYFEGELLSVALEVFLNLLLLRRWQIATTRRSMSHWIFVGTLCGLSALARPNILLFLVAAFWWMFARRSDAGWRSTLTRGLAVGISTALVIIPVTVRNYIVGDDQVVISSNGGVNFYIGNNAAYDSTVAIHPGMYWDDLVMEPVHAGLQAPSARSAYFVRKASSYILSQPLDYGALLLKKLWLFWNGPEIKRNQPIYYQRNHSWILSAMLWDCYLSVPFGLIAPLGLMGLFFSWCSRGPPLSLLRVYLLSYMLSVILFFVTARYRVPVIPVLLVFAGIGVDEIVKMFCARRFAAAAGALAVLSALLILLNWETSQPWQEDAQLYHDLGEVALRREDHAVCIEHSLRALELESPYPSARHNLAVAYFELDKLEASAHQARMALEEYGYRFDTRTLLAQVYLAQGAWRDAERELRQVVLAQPQFANAYYYLGRALIAGEAYLEAVNFLRHAAQLGLKNYWVYYELGQVYRKLGNSTAALRNYEQAHAVDTLQVEGVLAIGGVHLLEGRLSEARRWTEKALTLEPQHGEALLNLGLIELESGNAAAALSVLRRALVLAVDPKPVYRVLLQAYLQAGNSEAARMLLEQIPPSAPRGFSPK